MKQHKISLTTAILMNVNIMVGSGILIGPGVMAGIAGNASFLSWLIVALLFLPIVLSTVQMSRMCPGAGGFYAYAREGLNKTAGYWSGWLYVTGYTFAVAVEVLALRKTMFEALGDKWAWFTGNQILFNGVLACLIIAVNLLSLKLFSRLLNSLTISKMIPLVTLIVLIPFIFNPSFTITSSEMSMLPYALPMAIFGYFGFEYCCSISHLVENSERNAPLAILIGFFATALIYMLFHFGVLNLMGPKALTEMGAPAFAQFINLPIPYFKALMSILIPAASAITLFAAANGLLNANAVMLHTMAEERLFYFWPTLAQMTSWYRPWVTILLQGLIVFIITSLLPSISIIGNTCNLGVFLSFILPLVSLIVVQRKTGKHGNVPLSILALLSAIALALYSIYNLGTTNSERILYALPFLLFVAIGAILSRKE
jgi:amino acid transporter